MSTVLRAIVLSLLAAPALLAQEKPWWETTKFSAVAFGDAYAVAGHHDEAIDGRDGFWIRRIYLTMDQKLSDTLGARLRLEMAHPGDFISSASMEPFVKDAWLRWRRSEALSLIVGIQPTPPYESVEEFWGYRAVEKTPLDLQRWRSTRDFGVALRGRAGEGKTLLYHAMVGNGSSTGPETNEGKLAALAVGWAPAASTIVELYADHEGRPGGTDRTTFQGFVAVRQDRWRAGLQYATQQRDRDDAESLRLDLASAFAVWNVRDDVSALVRIDRMFDPNPEGDRIPYLPFDPTAESMLLIAGVDFRIHPRFGVVPNVEWIAYDADTGTDPDDDLMARLTFYYSF